MPSFDHRWIIGRTRKAISRFQLITTGDRIAVGLSGGKDSVALLYLLSRIKSLHGFDFSLLAVHLDMGWGDIGQPAADVRILSDICQQLQVPLIIEPTHIAEIVFVARQESNPCALCANLRRGALNRVAVREGCNVVALGHHANDVIETFFLNLFFTGQFKTFQPRTYLSRTDLTVIRPLVWLEERNLIRVVEDVALPTMSSACPAGGQTKREEIKVLLARLEEQYPELHTRIFSALQNFKPQNLAAWSPLLSGLTDNPPEKAERRHSPRQ